MTLVDKINYRMKMRKLLQKADIQQIKIMNEELHRELERRNKK